MPQAGRFGVSDPAAIGRIAGTVLWGEHSWDHGRSSRVRLSKNCINQADPRLAELRVLRVSATRIAKPADSRRGLSSGRAREASSATRGERGAREAKVPERRFSASSGQPTAWSEIRNREMARAVLAGGGADLEPEPSRAAWSHGWLPISKATSPSEVEMRRAPKARLLQPERLKNDQCRMGFSTRK